MGRCMPGGTARHVLRILWLLLAVLVLSGGCKRLLGGGRGAVPIAVGRAEAKWVMIDAAQIGVEDGIRGAAARKILVEVLRASKAFTIDWGDGQGEMELLITTLEEPPEEEGGEGAPPGDASAGADAAAEDGGGEGEPGPAGLEVIYVLKYRGEEGWPLSTAIVIKAGAKDDLMVSKPMADVVSELVSSIARQAALLHEELPSLRVALKSHDDEIVTLAIQMLGEKKDHEVVPVLCDMLDQTPPGLDRRDEIIGALEKIADPRASPCLIRAFSGAEMYQEVQILRALSVTGGEEARQFLEAVATGHEFDPVRRIAKEALVSMGGP